MTPILLLLFGSLSGTLLSVLVGLLGARRTIGFGWAFILSLLLTPFFGLIITLFSDPLPYHGDRSYGCLGFVLGLLGLFCIIPFLWMLWAILMGGLFMMI